MCIQRTPANVVCVGFDVRLPDDRNLEILFLRTISSVVNPAGRDFQI